MESSGLPFRYAPTCVFSLSGMTAKSDRLKTQAGVVCELRVKWIRPAPWRFDNCLQASVKFIVASIRGSGAAQPMNMRKTARR